MATITSNASGLWSAGGSWIGGVPPANGDTAVIQAAHDIEFNVDQSGSAGVTVTLNGTLHASTTAGTYKLKMAGNMTGGGTLRAGTEGVPYPTNCIFEIIRNGFSISSSTLTYDLNCTEPTIKWVKLSGVEAIGQTVLSVDRDVTGDAQWISGARLAIVDVNFGVDFEERTFASATATEITLTSGLSAQKQTGAYILLMSRNVKITHSAATGNALVNAFLGRVFAEIQNASNAINGSRNIAIGGTANASYTNNPSSCTISAVLAGGGLSGATGCTLLSTSFIGGVSNALTTCKGCTLFGIVVGCSSGILDSSGLLVYGSIVGCSSAVSGGGGHSFSGATLQNTSDLSGGTAFNRAYNTLFGGTNEVVDYNNQQSGINNFNESINHDQTANAYRAWTKGGIIDSDTGTVFTGRARSYKHACATASFYAFQNRTFTVPPGGGLVVQCYVRKTVTMAYLPRVWILTPGQEPFITGSPAHEDIMTDSVDTWEELNIVYANAGISPVEVVVRTVAKNASGNVFFDPIVTVLAPSTYDVYNTLLANVAAILADTNELQTDWVNGGRLDTILDARASQASVDTIDDLLDTEIPAITADLDTIEKKVDDNQALIIAS